MATRVIPPRILRNLRYNTATKPLNSTHPSSLSPTLSPNTFLDQKPQSSTVLRPAADPSALNLHDIEKLFSYVPTSKLPSSTAVLHATGNEPLVDLGMWVMRSKFMEMEGLRDVILAAIRGTF